MGEIRILLDHDGKAEGFEAILDGSSTHFVAEAGFVVATKADGTVNHKPVVGILFRVADPVDLNKTAQVHCVMSARQLLSIAYAIEAHHPGCGDRDAPDNIPPGMILTGVHKGIGWNAIRIDQAYVVCLENQTPAIAGSEKEARLVGEAMIEDTLREKS